jgi:hypothetical protein
MVVLRTTPQGDPAMTKTNITTDARVLVGIDISKNRHEVLMAVPAKGRRRRMTVLNTADDYQRLIESVAACSPSYPLQQVMRAVRKDPLDSSSLDGIGRE